MIRLNDSVLRGTLVFSGILMLLSLVFFGVGTQQGIAVLSGVMLSAIFVSSSAWVFDTFKHEENRLFTQVFFFSIAVRFLLVLTLFGILLGATKIDEFYFTVSFIISYLCQSVTEMIFLNKILQKE